MNSRMFDLSGKTAVVTGARRGIGAAIALALAEGGAHVIGASASLRAGSPIQTEIEALGGTFEPYRVNFADRDATEGFAAEVNRSHEIDILINNAGTIYREPAAEHSSDDWDRVLETNLSAPFLLAQRFGADMVTRGSGRIVFVASLLSFQGGITVPSYTASKHGVEGVVKALTNEWAASGVNVNAVAPGYIATDNTAPLREDPNRSEAILGRIPAGRWGEPSDLAGAAVFLCTDASTYVHGTTIVVDGGWMGR